MEERLYNNRERTRTSLASSPIWPIGSSLSGNLPVEFSEVIRSDVAKCHLRFQRMLLFSDIKRDSVYIVCYDIMWYIISCTVRHAILYHIVFCYLTMWESILQLSDLTLVWCTCRASVSRTVMQRCSINFYDEWRDLGPLIRILNGRNKISPLEFSFRGFGLGQGSSHLNRRGGVCKYQEVSQLRWK